MHNGCFQPFSHQEAQPLLRLTIETIEECLEKRNTDEIKEFILEMNQFAFPTGLINKVAIDLSQNFRRKMKRVHRDIRKNGFLKRLFQVVENKKDSIIHYLFDMERLYPWCIFEHVDRYEEFETSFKMTSKEKHVFTHGCCDTFINYKDRNRIDFIIPRFNLKECHEILENTWTWPKAYKCEGYCDFLEKVRKQRQRTHRLPNNRKIPLCDRGHVYYFIDKELSNNHRSRLTFG